MGECERRWREGFGRPKNFCVAPLRFDHGILNNGIIVGQLCDGRTSPMPLLLRLRSVYGYVSVIVDVAYPASPPSPALIGLSVLYSATTIMVVKSQQNKCRRRGATANPWRARH